MYGHKNTNEMQKHIQIIYVQQKVKWTQNKDFFFYNFNNTFNNVVSLALGNSKCIPNGQTCLVLSHLLKQWKWKAWLQAPISNIKNEIKFYGSKTFHTKNILT